jgi:hypothetical protein
MMKATSGFVDSSWPPRLSSKLLVLTSRRPVIFSFVLPDFFLFCLLVSVVADEGSFEVTDDGSVGCFPDGGFLVFFFFVIK